MLQAYVSFRTHVKRIVSNRINLLVSPSPYTDLVHNLQCVCTCSNDKKYTVANKQVTVNNMSLAVAEMGDRLATIDMGREVGAAMPRSAARAGISSNKMWSGPRPTSVPSGILIHPAVWPQYTNVTRQTHRHTYTDRQLPDSTKSPQKYPCHYTLFCNFAKCWFRKMFSQNLDECVIGLSLSPTLWTIRRLFNLCWAMGFRELFFFLIKSPMRIRWWSFILTVQILQPFVRNSS